MGAVIIGAVTTVFGASTTVMFVWLATRAPAHPRARQRYLAALIVAGGTVMMLVSTIQAAARL
jgi:hypothetical protein